jgi:hypothetical protein
MGSTRRVLTQVSAVRMTEAAIAAPVAQNMFFVNEYTAKNSKIGKKSESNFMKAIMGAWSGLHKQAGINFG